MAKNITATANGATVSGNNLKYVVSNLGSNIKSVTYNGTEYWKKDMSLPKIEASVTIRDPGISAWGDITYTDYFDVSDYNTITGYLGIGAHANYTSSYGISGTAHIYLFGRETINLGEISVSRYYGGDSTDGKNISYNIPSNLSGQYRLGIQTSGFRENTDSATQGYAYSWFENIVLS